jgi:ppGpp synthetase/RelA/SpoT-type nucleotidyltranferase
MNEQQLIERYRSEKPQFDALGRGIIELVKSSPQLSRPHSIAFVLPPQSRTKAEDSLLQKAFYRSKSYSDPYIDITDKVGVRFVVLTVDQVRLLKDVIEHLEPFDASLDRDFEEERKRNPTTFVYQSVHYVVRPKESIEIAGQVIPPGLPCEVQLRTVLQHAYSELTHDTIYKPKTFAEPNIHRLAARSMALIETTDEIFCQALRQFDQLDRSMDPMIEHIVGRFSIRVRFQLEPKLNIFILDSLKPLTKAVTESALDSFIGENDFVIERVNSRSDEKLPFRQPVILLLYYLAHKMPAQLTQQWPLLSEELDPIFADLGISRGM